MEGVSTPSGRIPMYFYDLTGTAMANGHPNEKRSKARTGVRMTMPIHLVSLSDGTSIDCRLADVAASGIGVIAKNRMEPGFEVRFKTLGKSWNLVVSWCDPAGGCFKCGLVLIDPSQDMSVLFSSFRDFRNAV